jgi:mono/diheme cytochrome c family protein
MPRRLALAAAAILAAFSAAAAQEQQQEVGISGERDFRIYCATCHGEDAKGNGPASFGLSVEPPDLTRLSRRNGGTFPRDRIEALIDGREELAAHGSREMPIWGEWFKMEAAEGLGGAEGPETVVRRRIRAVIDYLETIQE